MTTNSESERVQCCRTRACGWIGTKADYQWVPKSDGIGKMATCPRCGHAEFYLIDRLTEHEQRLVDAVRDAAAEAHGLPGALVVDVRWKAFRLWSDREVSSRLAKLAVRGHVVKLKDDRGKTRWALPKAEEAAVSS